MDKLSREHYVTGYHGEDSMRNKAERMFGRNMTKGGEAFPRSASAPEREKMRPYKEGGHVKHGLNKGQRDLHIPHRDRTSKLNIQSFEAAENMKHGGRAHKKHYAEGGELGAHSAYEEHQKHGGRIKRHEHHEIGGLTGRGRGFLGRGRLGPKPAGEGEMHTLPFHGGAMKHGGKVKHHGEHHHHKVHGKTTGHEIYEKGHGKHKYGHGGTVYERQMVGAHPSHKPHHFNYESEMRGEHAVHTPSHQKTSHSGKCDASHGTSFKRGGRTHHKLAAGGVAKIRHGVATKKGLPKSAKVTRG